MSDETIKQTAPYVGVVEHKSILKQADDLINGERAGEYGPYSASAERIATRWSDICKVKITPAQVTLMMIELKVARLINTPNHEDSWRDIAGYVGCWEKLQNGL